MYSKEIYIKAIQFKVIQNYSFSKIEKILKVNNKGPTRQIISEWYKHYSYNIDKYITRMNKEHFKNLEKNINNFDNLNILNFIYNTIINNPYITRYEISCLVYNKFQIKLNKNSITKIYRRLNLSFKKPKKYCVKSEKFLIELHEERIKFRNEIMLKTIENILSIDECSFNTMNNKSKGLSPIGNPIHLNINEIKIKNISLLLAINTKGIVNQEIIKTTINSSIFYNFILDIIKKANNKKYIFIYDNVRFHRTNKISNLIINNGHEFFYTPRYSPNNNPIENIFSLIKNEFFKITRNNKDIIYVKNDKIKSKSRRKILEENIILSIQNTFNKYTSEIFLKIFKRSLNYDYLNIEKELRDRIIIKQKDTVCINLNI